MAIKNTLVDHMAKAGNILTMFNDCHPYVQPCGSMTLLKVFLRGEACSLDFHKTGTMSKCIVMENMSTTISKLMGSDS